MSSAVGVVAVKVASDSAQKVIGITCPEWFGG